MTAQIALSVLLAGVLLYAGNERRRSPVVAWLSIVAAVAGLYFTWCRRTRPRSPSGPASAAASTSCSTSGSASR